jgi:hypothetical protein
MLKSCFTFAMLFAVFGLASTLHADEIYTYTGTPFISCEDSECSVSGDFDLPAPLGDDLYFATIYPTTFEFDGITQSTATASGFYISTNAEGQITYWSIVVEDGDVFMGGTAAFTYNVNPSDNYDDWENPCSVGECNAEAFIPGTWTESSVAATPEPSSYAFLVIGVAFVIFKQRRSAKKIDLLL